MPLPINDDVISNENKVPWIPKISAVILNLLFFCIFYKHDFFSVNSINNLKSISGNILYNFQNQIFFLFLQSENFECLLVTG